MDRVFEKIILQYRIEYLESQNQTFTLYPGLWFFQNKLVALLSDPWKKSSDNNIDDKKLTT